jgi:hypothetical protein
LGTDGANVSSSSSCRSLKLCGVSFIPCCRTGRFAQQDRIAV